MNDSVARKITPLRLAAHGDELILLLLNQGTDPDKARWHDGYTLLFLTAEGGSEEVVRALLTHGAAPGFDGNPKLRSLFETDRILGQDKVLQLKCLELIAEAKKR